MTLHPILVDTGPLFAILSQRDQFHDVCVDQLRVLTDPLLTCWPVLTEAAWLLKDYPYSLRKLLESFDAGLLKLLSIEDRAFPWIAEFMDRYQKLGVQLADACLMYLAERDNIDTILLWISAISLYIA